MAAQKDSQDKQPNSNGAPQNDALVAALAEIERLKARNEELENCSKTGTDSKALIDQIQKLKKDLAAVKASPTKEAPVKVEITISEGFVRRDH